MRRTAAAILALGLGSGANASPLDDYTSLYGFGDSLTDAGLAYAVAGIPQSPPYAQRFTNGPVWLEYLAASEFVGETVSSYAVGGAKAAPDLDVSPDLPLQKLLFLGQDPLGLLAGTPLSPDLLRGDPGARPLAAIWAGANDLFDVIDESDFTAAADAAVEYIFETAIDLKDAGVGDFMIFNLPDLGDTPRFALYEPDLIQNATNATLYFNALLDATISDLEDENNLKVTKIDVFTPFQQIVATPQAFGFDDAATPCVAFSALNVVSVCTPAEAAERVFFDDVHPNTDVHALVAQIVIDAYEVAPVPIPAALPLAAGAFAFLFAVGRRKT